MRCAASNAPAIREVVRNPRGAEGVAAYRRFNSRIASTAPDHGPDIGARHRRAGEFFRLADRGAEQRPLAIYGSAKRLNNMGLAGEP